MEPAGIEVRDLTVEFQGTVRVLNSLSMSVPPGDIVALLGGSGSGKSTLLRTIARLQKPTSGSVEFTGQVPVRRASDLAYVFQDATLLPWRSVLNNVLLPLELSDRVSTARKDASVGSELPSRRERAAEALRSVGLNEATWNRYPRELSGGMRMRVSLARAIVTDPAVLLLDEPFGALDEILRGRMNELITDLWEARPRTIVFVTHNIAEALNLSRRIAILGSGRIHTWIDNPLPFPRTSEVRGSAEFASLYAHVSQQLSHSVEAAA